MRPTLFLALMGAAAAAQAAPPTFGGGVPMTVPSVDAMQAMGNQVSSLSQSLGQQEQLQQSDQAKLEASLREMAAVQGRLALVQQQQGQMQSNGNADDNDDNDNDDGNSESQGSKQTGTTNSAAAAALGAMGDGERADAVRAFLQHGKGQAATSGDVADQSMLGTHATTEAQMTAALAHQVRHLKQRLQRIAASKARLARDNRDLEKAVDASQSALETFHVSDVVAKSDEDDEDDESGANDEEEDLDDDEKAQLRELMAKLHKADRTKALEQLHEAEDKKRDAAEEAAERQAALSEGLVAQQSLEERHSDLAVAKSHTAAKVSGGNSGENDDDNEEDEGDDNEEDDNDNDDDDDEEEEEEME